MKRYTILFLLIGMFCFGTILVLAYNPTTVSTTFSPDEEEEEEDEEEEEEEEEESDESVPDSEESEDSPSQTTVLSNPTGSQNYIRTRTYTKADGSTFLDVVNYYDGLGRPVQTVQTGITPDQKDLITIQEYDAFGRASKTGLPMPKANNTGAYHTGGITANSIYGNDNYAYSEPIYEASPLNRIVKQYGPGQAWRSGNGHALEIDYLTNNGDYPCALYFVNGNNVVRNGNYANNSLYVTKTTDEDGKVAYEFKDKLGQVVLQRQVDTDGNYDTYYVYDDFGNLRFVLPPLAADATTGGTYTETSAALKDYAYLYRYDNRNRCTWKKLPGAEPVYYQYDSADRLIFTQDGELRDQSLWKFSIPDVFGRVVLEGTCATPSITGVAKVEYTGVANTTSGYTVSGITWSSMQVLQTYYYDNYNFKLTQQPFAGNSAYDDVTPTGFDNQRYGTDTDPIKAKGLLTGSITYLLGGYNSTLGSVFYYDSKGRVIQSIAQNHLSGYEKNYVNYSFTGQPTWKKHIHSVVNKPVITETYRYGYDHANRLTTTHYQLDNTTEILLSNLTYDDLGRVQNKQIDNNTQTIAYTYTIRNWLKSINVPNVFNETLYYEDSYAGSTPLYNGNIAATTNSGSGYRYEYDGLNRLTQSLFLEDGAVNNRFNEALTYDKHGNILTLQRNSGSTPTLMDDLTLSYTGNQLSHITDAVSNSIFSGFVKPYGVSNNEYDYNTNGAMTKDLNRGVQTVSYNPLNLPKEIQFVDGHRTTYVYDATGVKRRVSYSTAESSLNVPSSISAVSLPTLTNDYCGNIIYENGNLKYILTPESYVMQGTIIYFPSPNGYAPPTNTVFYGHNYYLKDHLGNVRQVSGQVTNYYPFGMVNDALSTSQELQPYKFGGKELDEMHGLNWYDQGFRPFDAIIPRTPTMDPLAEKYYNTSPYVQWSNNPVRYVDPTGLSWRPTYDEDNNGNKAYNGYEWIDENKSYDTDGNLLPGLYSQAIFFSNNGTFDASSNYNMGSSTSTVYLADGTTTTFDANTNPSSSDYATVPEGIYQATVGTHNGSASSYTALKMRDVDATSQTIELGQANPAHPERTYAEGINIHKPGKRNLTGTYKDENGKTRPISEGCLLIDRNNWDNFIGNFDTDEQRTNTVSVTVSRSMSTPANVNRLPAFNFFMSGTRRSFFSPF
ncbi:MAG: DUF6443 domain-containing protein [Candidatus Symbiothrix sp.]|jgi:RHS repeat-associated protein|nr:DUF6443 domain-containing protein [Candidatus Symbiothrix sp.]